MAITQWQITQQNITDNGVVNEADVPVRNPVAMKQVFDRLPSFIVGKYNSLITELNTWWDNLLSKINTTGSADGLSVFSNDLTYRTVIPYTGFTNNSNINVAYNSTTRKISLSGVFYGYYCGKIISEMTNGWISPAHDAIAGTYYLFYGANGVSFTTTPWSFSDLMIACVQYNAHNVAIREVHGFMQAEAHMYDHIHFGTMKRAGGNFTSYIVNSTTPADRRPNISETLIDDEDCASTIPALTSKLYTQRYLSGTGTIRSFNTDQADIIALNGNIPYYNQNNNGDWIQTPFPVGYYGAVFVVAIPTTSDAESQKLRYMFVQPQQISTLLSDIQALTPASLTHGDANSLVSEYAFIAKIIIQYTSNNWKIVETISELSGNKIQQTASTGSIPIASAITYVPTGNISATDVQTAIAEVSSEASSGVNQFIFNTTDGGLDCNTITKEWHLGGNGGTNYPINASGTWFYVNTIFYTSSRTRQIAYGYSGNSANLVYTRQLYSGVWSNWVQIMTANDIGLKNQSVSSQSGFASETYLTGSYITFPYLPKVGTTYKLTFDVTKTAAGTATPIINIKLGTAGTTSDTTRCTFTFGAGTTVIDSGIFEVICTFRTVGGTTNAVIQGVSKLTNNLTTTGISNAVKAVFSTSAGFDSTVTSLGIGASYNAGTSASHTIQLVRAELIA